MTLGTVVGHGCCTALAVVGGRYLSTKISVKHGTFGILLIPLLANLPEFPLVTFGGSLLFLLFGVIYLYEAIAMSPGVEMSIPISPDA